MIHVVASSKRCQNLNFGTAWSSRRDTRGAAKSCPCSCRTHRQVESGGIACKSGPQAAWSHLRSPWLRERLPTHRQRRSNRLRLDRKYTLSTEICALGADKRPTRRKPTMWGPTVVYIYKADLRPTCPMGDVWGGGADKWPTKGRRQKR